MAVLGEEADEVEAAQRVLARRGRERAGVVGVERLELGEVPVERGHVARAQGAEGADFEDFAWGVWSVLCGSGQGINGARVTARSSRFCSPVGG